MIIASPSLSVKLLDEVTFPNFLKRSLETMLTLFPGGNLLPVIFGYFTLDITAK